MVGNAREDGKDRGQQLDETSVVELNLVEARPLSKYMASRARNASPGLERTKKERKRKNKNLGP